MAELPERILVKMAIKAESAIIKEIYPLPDAPRRCVDNITNPKEDNKPNNLKKIVVIRSLLSLICLIQSLEKHL